VFVILSLRNQCVNSAPQSAPAQGLQGLPGGCGGPAARDPRGRDAAVIMGPGRPAMPAGAADQDADLVQCGG